MCRKKKNRFWATAQLYSEKKKFCVAIQFLYCREKENGGQIVLQHNTLYCDLGLQEENCVAIQNCIATERLGSWAGRWAGLLGTQGAGRWLGVGAR